MKCLYVGFKGEKNLSCVLVKRLSDRPYLLTNSFQGIAREIRQLENEYDSVLMFGVDKTLQERVRIM